VAVTAITESTSSGVAQSCVMAVVSAGITVTESVADSVADSVSVSVVTHDGADSVAVGLCNSGNGRDTVAMSVSAIAMTVSQRSGHHRFSDRCNASMTIAVTVSPSKAVTVAVAISDWSYNSFSDRSNGSMTVAVTVASTIGDGGDDRFDNLLHGVHGGGRVHHFSLEPG